MATAPAQPASANKTTEPDYPDPRTLTVGAFYWFAGIGSGPDVRSGKLAFTNNESLLGLGKTHATPGIEISMPVTRTGTLHFEGFRAQGTGNQTNPSDTALFTSGFNKGDSLAINYKTISAKLYLEDLLFPHKFPVSRFRLKSLWEVQYVYFYTSIDALNSTTNQTTGTRTLVLPSFGLAAEYAIAPHVLLRAAGSGFGIPHRSVIWDGEATISVRQNKIELVGGAKAFHYKTSPAKEEYITQGIYGGFVGLRYHFGS